MEITSADVDVGSAVECFVVEHVMDLPCTVDQPISQRASGWEIREAARPHERRGDAEGMEDVFVEEGGVGFSSRARGCQSSDVETETAVLEGRSGLEKQRRLLFGEDGDECFGCSNA